MASTLGSGSPDSPAVRSPGPDRGVAVTSVDGGLASIGAAGDTAATPTVIGRLVALLARLPATLGQKTGAASLSVVLASDQGVLTAALSGGATLTAGQVAVDTTAGGKLILAQNPNRRGAIIKLPSTATATVYLGPSGVATNTGHFLEPGESAQVDTTAAVYGTLTAGTQTVSVLEQSA